MNLWIYRCPIITSLFHLLNLLHVAIDDGLSPKSNLSKFVCLTACEGVGEIQVSSRFPFRCCVLPEIELRIRDRLDPTPYCSRAQQKADQ